MSQAQEPSASQQQLQQPTDEPKVLGGGNMDPTNPLAGLENPEAEAKAIEMGASIPSQGPPPELSEESITEPASSGNQNDEARGGSQQATERETVQESGSQPAPGSQA
ncbi:hypothetical protein Vafri_11733 [Volvox africanus]|uniref:Uncharacterized protein n=1 Tax=Volvox africanus TaxID=51714 RepID=A0A8J4B9I2_9CHLO|nr:hypothetical protein Vafri_11733 [Volvox africanus]